MGQLSGLCLSRKRDESVVLDLREWGLGLFEILNVEPRADRSRLLFAGDRRIPIHRKEVFEEMERSKAR